MSVQSGKRESPISQEYFVQNVLTPNRSTPPPIISSSSFWECL